MFPMNDPEFAPERESATAQQTIQPEEQSAYAARQQASPFARAGTAALIVVSLAIGGGLAGGIAATALMPPPLPATVTLAQPASFEVPVATPETVAGAVYQSAGPGVVDLQVLGQRRAGTTVGGGSGFVVDASGLIITNQHVVDGADRIRVRFNNGEIRDAQVVGTDQSNDLALLKVDLPEGIPALPLGDSSIVEVGDTAIAIGSPFGLGHSVTQGIISAVDRTWNPGAGRTRYNLLQTDAPINPGNSGGPLLNARGEVIGVTSMIESPIRGSVGVGFAVPSNVARQLLPQLAAGANLKPVWLGISGREVTASLAEQYSLPVTHGILIGDVVQNGPAARAGLRGGSEENAGGGDIIVQIDGTSIATMADLTQALSGRQPGDSIAVEIYRNGRPQTVTVTLQAWPTGAM